MMGDIIDLTAYRATRQDHGEETTTIEVRAAGPDDVELEIRSGSRTSGVWAMTRDGANLISRMLGKARRDARDWDKSGCCVCGEKRCYEWHPGLILERNQAKYHVGGRTTGGRVRLIPLDGGKTKYTRQGYPHHWGRIVGYRVLDADGLD